MRPVRITAALIAKNEARHIGACLASLAGQVDDVVVVDTGSEDSTPQIAAESGARVFSHPWTGDFSAARNCALELAAGNWILYIDADERLSVPDAQRLHQAIDPEAHAGLVVRLHPRPGHTPYEELRLFMRDPRVRFEGRIHEQILPTVRAVCASDGKGVGSSTVTLHHVGYEGDISHKHARNLPLLRRAVEEHPYRLYCWFHLGETLSELGELDRAEQALRRGIAIGLERNTEHDRAEASLCYQRLAKIANLRGKDARAIVTEGLRNWPDDACLRLMKARDEIEFGDPAAALPELSALAAIDANAFFDRLMSYDRRTFSLWPHALAGAANMRLGRLAEAEAAFGRAAASPDASWAERIEFAAKAQVAAANLRTSANYRREAGRALAGRGTATGGRGRFPQEG